MSGRQDSVYVIDRDPTDGLPAFAHREETAFQMQAAAILREFYYLSWHLVLSLWKKRTSFMPDQMVP